MAQAALGSAGLHFDELNKLRVLDPDVAQQTAQLREECKAFVDSECCAPGPGCGALHFPPRSAKSPDRACALRGLGTAAPRCRCGSVRLLWCCFGYHVTVFLFRNSRISKNSG